MALPTINGTGRLTGDPELRFSPPGVAVCTVNLAFNSRRKNPQTQEWEDGDVFFIRGTAFKQVAENIAESLTKGLEVVVSGRMKTEQWEDKNGGGKRSAPSLMIDSIGPSLQWQTASARKAERGASGSGGFASPPASDDPWGSAPQGGQSSEAPF